MSEDNGSPMHLSPEGTPSHSSVDVDDSSSSAPPSSARKTYGVIEDENELPARMKLLLQKLKRFFTQHSFADIVLPIIRDRDPIALRDIDWLVTNYSKAFPVVYASRQDPTQPFDVHKSYVAHEAIWKKRLFDPFQRGERIRFAGYETTIAQLHFFSWCIETGVLEWAIRNREVIRQHHAETKAARKELIKQQPNRKKKRMRLTEADTQHCVVYLAPMTVSLSSGGNGSSIKKAPTILSDGRKKAPPPVPEF